MKIIDLLNKIANKEEMPKKIIVHGVSDYEMKLTTSNKNYVDNDNDLLFSGKYDWKGMLNYEIEIIEEPKKLEKLELKIYNAKDLFELQMFVNKDISDIKFTLNEIIDYINKGDNNE